MSIEREEAGEGDKTKYRNNGTVNKKERKKEERKKKSEFKVTAKNNRRPGTLHVCFHFKYQCKYIWSDSCLTKK